ncbi:MAG: HAD-IIA family hydrolase [Candidatus Bathyarchaeia archaeon]
MKLSKMRLFLFDMDGVLSIGKETPRYLAGREVIARIKSSGRKALVLTNDSTHSREEIHQNLVHLGFNFDLDDILTSSYLTALYLTQRYRRPVSFFLVGENGLLHELQAAGHEFSESNPDVVVVGFDRGLSYRKLDLALRFLRNTSALIGSYGGAVFMSDHGPALSAGPIIKALEYGSHKKATMIGKPSSRMFNFALKRANEKAENTVMIGDQIETDLLGAKKVGIHTILVLSGVENEASITHSPIKPEFIVENVDRLTRYL